MSFKYLQTIPTVDEIKHDLPLPSECAAIKKLRDEKIKSAISGAIDRFLVIVGPCSAHDENAMCDYV
ncbi:MAG TPA: 3-deoxy-7-phosphoheptulonate synthase, partial [Fibrobacteres bacterium]|nr:3-deoxy-7-phosphoheptulonate synthase [Fibrobacterota bacterium]